MPALIAWQVSVVSCLSSRPFAGCNFSLQTTRSRCNDETRSIVERGVSFRYIGGYPRRHLRTGIVGVAGSLGCGLPLTGLAVSAFWVSATALLTPATRSPFNLFGVLFAGYFTFCFGYGMVIGGVRDSMRARIVPYFESRIGRHDAFRHGAVVARRCASLDELCLARGVRPISSFGFADDIRGERVVWYDASEGLLTIRELVAAVHEEILLGEDLRAMEQALLRASEEDIRFCFILRNGMDHYISPMEMDRRVGSFW